MKTMMIYRYVYTPHKYNLQILKLLTSLHFIRKIMSVLFIAVEI